MEIKFSENCSVNVTLPIPCAIVAAGDGICIDKAHPHAQELASLAAELMSLTGIFDDAKDEQWDRLMGRIKELTDERAAGVVWEAWRCQREAEFEARAKREAWDWFKAWNSMPEDKLPEVDTMFLSALYNIAPLSKGNANGVLAIFSYGYQCGKASSVATEGPDEE